MRITCPTHQVVSQSRVGVRIGGVEFTYNRTDGLVLGDSQGSGDVKVARWSRNLLEREAKADVVGACTWLYVGTLS